VVVHHGDFTALAGRLRQQVVFLDPPWGGPQYSSAPPAAAAAAGGGPGEASEGGGEQVRAAAVSDLPLGDGSVAQLCAQLCSSGAALVVGVKLPRTLDLPAFCARVVQQLAAGSPEQQQQCRGVAAYSAEFGSTAFLLLGCWQGGGEVAEAALHAAMAGWPGRGAARLCKFDAAAGCLARVR
jgi:hypothetical protein